MDDEEREALDMTKDELLALKRDAKPAKLARSRRDVNQRAASIVERATADRSSPVRQDIAGITFTHLNVKTQEKVLLHDAVVTLDR